MRKYRYQASLGYGWSRAEVQKLYAGEEYHLLVDSHTWFADGWDENLIAQLEGKPSAKPLLTTSSPPFTFDEDGEVVIPWAGTDMDGVPHMKCRIIPPAGWIDIQMSRKRKRRPHEVTALICCNFVFTHGRWITEVPEDPGMVNAAHESALSARSYTHGYDLYLPDSLQVWHLDYNNYPDGYRPRVWEAKSDGWQHERTENMIRRLHALLFGRGDASILGRFQLGQERSIDEWADLAGLRLVLDGKEQTPEAGVQPEDDSSHLSPETNVSEAHLGGYIYASEENPNGDPWTWTPAVWDWAIEEFGAKSMLDIGCGEGHAAGYFQSRGCRVLGVDGSVEAREASVIPRRHATHDFTTGSFKPPGKPYDLVWSCEFVEHVEQQFSTNFLETFARARKAIILTYAGPGQPGWHHVNLQPEEYWIKRIEALGFSLDRARTETARSHAEAQQHFRHRGLVFVRSR
ncbi:MAG: GlcNAc-transferase family protein [Pseudomonadota bacterium]